jgi:hypothetical protein
MSRLLSPKGILIVANASSDDNPSHMNGNLRVSLLSINGEDVVTKPSGWHKKRQSSGRYLNCLTLDAARKLQKGDSFIEITIHADREYETEDIYWLAEGYWRKRCFQ